MVAILKRWTHTTGGLGGGLGLERIGEDDPEEEQIFRDLWEDETQR